MSQTRTYWIFIKPTVWLTGSRVNFALDTISPSVLIPKVTASDWLSTLGEQTSHWTHAAVRPPLQPWAALPAAHCCFSPASSCPARSWWTPTAFPWRPPNSRPFPATTKRRGSCRVWPSPTSTRTDPTATSSPWTVWPTSTCTLRWVELQACRPPGGSYHPASAGVCSMFSKRGAAGGSFPPGFPAEIWNQPCGKTEVWWIRWI